MNIRLSDNKVRFRITEDELHVLMSNNILMGKTNFPNGNKIIYRVSLSNDETHLSLVNGEQGSAICVAFPKNAVAELESETSTEKNVSEVVTLEDGLKCCFSLEVDIFDERKRGLKESRIKIENNVGGVV